jgi:type I restriction enzyme M protein
LKTRQFRWSDLENFVACYNVEDRRDRSEAERFKAFEYNELVW